MEIKWYKELPKAAMELRSEVFVNEQGFCDEFDETDAKAIHFVGYENGIAVAVARIYLSEQSGVYMFGRLAVKKQARDRGLGREMLRFAENHALEKGAKALMLHAQLQAKGFYEACGYTPCGEIDYEQDCPHIMMTKRLGGIQ